MDDYALDETSVSQTFLLMDPIRLWKINTSLITQIQRLDDRYPNLKIYISELILDKY
jgi:hypothetical protein